MREWLTRGLGQHDAEALEGVVVLVALLAAIPVAWWLLS